MAPAMPELVERDAIPGVIAAASPYRSLRTLSRRGRKRCSGVNQARPRLRMWTSSSAAEPHGNIGEFFRSSGGLDGSPSDQPPCPTSGNNGRLCSQARQTSEMVPARPPMTMHASPERAIKRLRASPIPLGMTTVAGQSAGGIWSGGMMLTTRPPEARACSAATLVAGLPQPLTTVTPSRARSAPASPANS